MSTNDYSNELSAALVTTSHTYTALLADYQELALCHELTDKDADRLDQIYAEAEKDQMLNFLLTEIDHGINKRVGLLSDEAIEGYQDQQAWLRERVEQTPFEHDHHQEVQRMLADEGFYEGPIDGVLGSRYTDAIKEMTTQLQERLSVRGFYKRNIDGEFGRFSSEAVKAFQQSKSLKDSGVPNKETLSALRSD
ncbi:MAG: peptidoglycan-binding domain-containing protein [Cyanobacteria bacterium P01_D01_bin.36]